MNTDLKKVIKSLSQLYDTDSQDSFVSLYFNRREDPNFLKRRIHACESLLDDDEKKNFQSTIKKITSFLDKNHENDIAVFASEKHEFFTWTPLPTTINNALIVDSSPYIRPLARVVDEWESFTLVLLNSHQAKIFSIHLGSAEQKKLLSSDIMNKHKKGGWSQARFQRIRKGAIHDFFTEVIEYLQHYVDNQIILAGPGTAKTQFKDLLPQHLSEKVVDLIDVDINDEHESISRSLNVISETEEAKSENAVSRLKQEILKNGLAVYGFDETLKAARNGQIDVLIVQKDYQLKGCLCEHCQILKAGPVKDCPVCGSTTTEADMIEEIIEFSERTDASIEFTDKEEISHLGHIGGLLRYKVSS
ncbi:MAG TPA: Vms1/Ankzf1 family peptidyl-tRNA hydrolase [Candidatus Thermoplasmatota archaeon]|nr:Vms1/Ankzf1 family peptidyl-tRNA hydrolase [Candidatus Thermoplasmatota archaeon]